MLKRKKEFASHLRWLYVTCASQKEETSRKDHWPSSVCIKLGLGVRTIRGTLGNKRETIIRSPSYIRTSLSSFACSCAWGCASPRCSTLLLCMPRHLYPNFYPWNRQRSFPFLDKGGFRASRADMQRKGKHLPWPRIVIGRRSFVFSA